jgi:hypothetical protein
MQLTTWAPLILLAALLLAEPFAGKRFLGTTLFPWLHIEAVPLDLLDDVFLLDLALETAQGVFQRFAFLNGYFRQNRIHPHPCIISN